MSKMSPTQAGQVLGLSARTVSRMIDRGELLAESTPGGHRRVDPDALIEYQRKRISSTLTVLTPPTSEAG